VTSLRFIGVFLLVMVLVMASGAGMTWACMATQDWLKRVRDRRYPGYACTCATSSALHCPVHGEQNARSIGRGS
jgi:hypothetical protein